MQVAADAVVIGIAEAIMGIAALGQDALGGQALVAFLPDAG